MMQSTIIIIALVLSAFFSGTETVLLSASKIRLEVMLRKGRKGAHLVKQYADNPEAFITTILVGNNITIVVYSSIFALYLDLYFSKFTGIVISSVLALLVAEIIPKAIGWEFANRLAFKVTPPLKFFQFLFAPITFFLEKVSRLILGIFRMKDQQVKSILTRKDLESFIKESAKAGIVEKEERIIISRIFDFGETKVKETMIPRTEIQGISKESTMADLFDMFVKSGFSRLPVYDGDIDDIIGVVHAKDLFKFPHGIETIMQEIQHVPETKDALDLLQEFRMTRTSIAIVLDEYGGTSGLVTFEDLVEELFGEIYDEFDLDHDNLFKRLNRYAMLVKARAEIDELNEKFNLKIPEGDYTTIGGYVIDKLGKIPKEGEKIDLDTSIIVVSSASKKKVNEVKIIRKKI
ncbi:DUF21 domain-containing protein [candidate division KSB1 bacterium]|nr:DUF21 domain-containing protein [candidate division KSB1 bacterium]